MDKKEAKELARGLYELLEKDSLEGFVNLLRKNLENEKTKKLRIVKTDTLNSIGKELGEFIVNKEWKYERLLRLWKLSGTREIRLIVINALSVVSKLEYEGVKAFIMNILDDLNDWETVDALALRVVTNLVKKNKGEAFSLLREWAASENKWVRRLSVATIASYVKSRPGDARLCLEVIEELMHEGDKDVKRAVAWALREISKRDPEAVYKFLLKYAQSNDVNTRWIVKEGSKKLQENRKP